MVLTGIMMHLDLHCADSCPAGKPPIGQVTVSPIGTQALSSSGDELQPH